MLGSGLELKHSQSTPSPVQTPNRDTQSSSELSTPETESPEYPELQSIMIQTETVLESTKDDIVKWVIYKYNRSKGFEISTTNPSLMPSLFAEQS